MEIQRSCISFKVGFPYNLEDAAAEQRHTPVAHQQNQQVKFLWRERYRPLRRHHFPALNIYLHIIICQAGVYFVKSSKYNLHACL